LEEQLMSKFTSKSVEETEQSYLLWRKDQCELLQRENLKRKSEEAARKQEIQLQKLKANDEQEKHKTIVEYQEK